MQDYSTMTYEQWARGKDVRRPEREPTVAEMLQGVRENVAEAAAREAEARRRIAAAEIGSPELNQARVDLSRAQADQKHWTGYVAHYERELAKVVAAARIEAAHERQPGEDDDEGGW